jgi:hypothetical protein
MYVETGATKAAQAMHGARPAGGQPKEKLHEIAARLRKMLRDNTLDAAVEIVAISSRWERDYASQAKGQDFAQWLRSFSQRPLSYYQDRATQRARHKTLRTDIPGKVDARAEYWLRRATDEQLPGISVAIAAAYRKAGSVQLSVSQVHKMFPELVQQRPGPAIDRQELINRIVRLEAQIRAGCEPGTEPVE